MAISPRHIASLVTGSATAIALFAVLYSGFKSSEAVRTDGATLQVASAASNNEDTGGRLGELTPEFDLGVIRNDEETVKTLTIRNVGSGTLEIKDVRTSCGCTKGHFKDRRKQDVKSTKIAAGESAELYISVDPFRVPGFDSRKTLTLFTNDPDQATASLDVLAKVDPEFEVDPEQLHLGVLDKGDTATAQAIVRQLTDSEFDVTSVRAGARANETYTAKLALRPESEWRTPGKREWTLDVELNSETLRKGLFRDRVYIETTCERLRTYGYMINAEIDSFYSVIPEMLHRRDAVEPGAVSVTSAIVSSEQTISIEELTSSDPHVVVDVKKDGGASNTIILDLSVSPNATPGVKNATIDFTVVGADGSRAAHTLRAIVAVKQPE